MRNIGVCGTDLHAFRGRQPFFTYPRILGHELAVDVVDVGNDVTALKAGDRCAVNPYLNCGTCQACRRGKTNCCETLKVLGVHIDGGMRERFNVPASHLYLGNDLTDSQLALVETLGIGAHAVGRAMPVSGEPALVIGSGPIGLAVMEFLRIADVPIHLLELSGSRRSFANANYPVARMYANREEALAANPVTTVFDCTGNPHSMNSALSLVANGGKLIFVGLFVGDVTFHDPDFHRKEISLLATRNCTAPEHLRILEHIREGRINTAPWVSDTVKASDMIPRFPHWTDPNAGVVKAIIDWL